MVFLEITVRNFVASENSLAETLFLKLFLGVGRGTIFFEN
jgi:hypothetical protein